MSAQCKCPHVYTAIGAQRSGWSADCPVHGKTTVGVFGDGGFGVMFQAEASCVGKALPIVRDTSYPPTSNEINALPPNLRRWIHELHTDADPAGTIARCALLEDENAQLRAALAERDDDAEKWRALMACSSTTDSYWSAFDERGGHVDVSFETTAGPPRHNDLGMFERFMQIALQFYRERAKS